MKGKRSRNRERGKDAEREIAKIFGGKRIGVLSGEDVMHDIYSIEVKSRKKFIADNWMKQAEKHNKNNKVPLVVVHKTGSPHRKDLVIININDFLEWQKKNG